jgi:ubiquinone/menaquinone biosynthesis C-methylase UbiE
MNDYLGSVIDVVRTNNRNRGQWAYLTSIEYMLESRLYVDSLRSAAVEANKWLNNRKCNVLDFGTGSGIFAILLREFNKNAVISAIDTYHDPSQKDPNFKTTFREQALIWEKFSDMFGIDFSHYDGFSIPFPDQTFDFVTACAVIEHLESKHIDAILCELTRVMTSNGLLFVFKVPRILAPAEYLAGFLGLGRHEILYSDKQVKNLFQKHDFEIIKYWKSDIVTEFPGRITNLFYPILKVLDWMGYYSPLRVFAHHNNCVLKKCSSKT